MKKEELELLSNKDIAALILGDSKRTLNTADLYKNPTFAVDNRSFDNIGKSTNEKCC